MQEVLHIRTTVSPVARLRLVAQSCKRVRR